MKLKIPRINIFLAGIPLTCCIIHANVLVFIPTSLKRSRSKSKIKNFQAQHIQFLYWLQKDRYRSMPDNFQSTLFFHKKACNICYKRGDFIKTLKLHFGHHGGCSSQIYFKLCRNTDHFKLVLKRYNCLRGRVLLKKLSNTMSPLIEVSSLDVSPTKLASFSKAKISD